MNLEDYFKRLSKMASKYKATTKNNSSMRSSLAETKDFKNCLKQDNKSQK